MCCWRIVAQKNALNLIDVRKECRIVVVTSQTQRQFPEFEHSVFICLVWWDLVSVLTDPSRMTKVCSDACRLCWRFLHLPWISVRQICPYDRSCRLLLLKHCRNFKFENTKRRFIDDVVLEHVQALWNFHVPTISRCQKLMNGFVRRHRQDYVVLAEMYSRLIHS